MGAQSIQLSNTTFSEKNCKRYKSCLKILHGSVCDSYKIYKGVTCVAVIVLVVAQYTVGCIYMCVHISFITFYYAQTLQTILCCISMSYAVPMQPTPLGGAVATPTIRV